ncbi:hypothetical protein HK104_000702 [Borealophlyctis nickersoniae]|nr:hypothetical protein HK104_000702 [Borealophlyctis nickersoniae]
MAQEERPGRRMEQQLPPEHDQNLAPAAIPESNFNNPANASISPASSLSSVATTSTSSSTFIPYTDSTFTLSPHHYQPNVPPPSFEYRQPDPIPQFHDPPPPPPTTITTTTTSPDPRLFPRAYTCPATPAWKTALFSHEVIQSLLHTHHTVVQPRIRGESMHVPTFFQIPRSKFVVYAYCAFAAGYCDHPTILAYRREFNVPLCRVGEVYYQAARGMLGQVLEEHSFDNARGLSAVGFYARECGEVSASLQYCGMAIRMALEIRLNIDPDVEEVHGPLTWVEKEQRRRWWLGMCIEEFMASQKDDRPSAIGETDRSEPINPNSKVKPFVNEAIFYSVTTWDGVPTTEALALMNEPGVGAVTAEATSLYLRALGLCGTVTSILRRSKSESPIQLDPSEDPVYLTMQRNALEHQITDWMNSLPTWISDISVYPGDDPTRVDRFEPWNIYSIHIVYHASFLVLHFPAMLVGGRPPHPSASSSSASTSSSTDALTHEHSYATCLHRARIVASLCRAMGPVAFFGYYMCWFLYHTALVLIMETRDAQRVGDEGRAQMGKRDLEAVVSVMECVSRRSFVGRHILEGIEAVMSEELEDVGALGVGVGVGVGSSSAVGGAGGGVGAGVWGTAGYEE